MRRPPFKDIAEQVRDRMFSDPQADITADQLDHFIMMCNLELMIWRESDPRDEPKLQDSLKKGFDRLFETPVSLV